MKIRILNFMTEQFSYKLIALVIAILLWVTILGRRDFIYSTDLIIELNPVVGTRLLSANYESIKVRLAGPREALSRFVDNPSNKRLGIMVGEKGPGVYQMEIPVHRLDIPFGVKVIGLKPSVIRVEIAQESMDYPPPAPREH